MATVILALGDGALRRLCEAELSRAGHATVTISRPLEVLHVAGKVAPELVLVDDTPLGRDALRASAGRAIVGLGLRHEALRDALPSPVTGPQVVDLVERLAGTVASPAAVLTLDARRRVAQANGSEVGLTPTECHLLQGLLSGRGRQLNVDEALEAAWGPGDWSGNVGVLRAHVRNLRLKLAQIGLPNAVRSLRGKGYALVLG